MHVTTYHSALVLTDMRLLHKLSTGESVWACIGEIIWKIPKGRYDHPTLSKISLKQEGGKRARGYIDPIVPTFVSDRTMNITRGTESQHSRCTIFHAKYSHSALENIIHWQIWYHNITCKWRAFDKLSVHFGCISAGRVPHCWYLKWVGSEGLHCHHVPSSSDSQPVVGTPHLHTNNNDYFIATSDRMCRFPCNSYWLCR